MLKGELNLFTTQICNVVGNAFRDVYPIKGEAVSPHILEVCDQITKCLPLFIKQESSGKVSGKPNRKELEKCIIQHFRNKMLSFTPNLPRTINNRTTEFSKIIRKHMVLLYRSWEKKDVNIKPRTRRIRTKATPSPGPPGSRETLADL